MKILCLIILLLIQQILLAQANTLTGKNGIVQYTIYTSNDTAKIVDGCYFKIDYKQYYNDSLLVDSKQSMPQLVHVDSNVSIDFKQIFLQAKKGDSIITIQQVNDLPNKDALPLFLQSGGNLNTHYYIAAIYYDKESAEKEVTAITNQKLIADSIKNVITIKAQSTIIDQYVTANKLHALKKTSGLQIVILKKGIEGLGLKINKKVSIKYTGKTLDGSVFDSNIDSTFEHTEPLQFTIGAGQVIKGLDEGLTYFNEGATGLIIIPSPLAYGENGSGEIIGKNQILIFEIEVLKSKIKPMLTNKKKNKIAK